MEQQTQQSDHDLLVTLVAKVDAFIAGQVAAQNDHEARLRVLEKAAISQQSSEESKSSVRREFSANAKWAIGTLIALLAVAVAVIGMLWSSN